MHMRLRNICDRKIHLSISKQIKNHYKLYLILFTYDLSNLQNTADVRKKNTPLPVICQHFILSNMDSSTFYCTSYFDSMIKSPL